MAPAQAFVLIVILVAPIVGEEVKSLQFAVCGKLQAMAAARGAPEADLGLAASLN